MDDNSNSATESKNIPNQEVSKNWQEEFLMDLQNIYKCLESEPDMENELDKGFKKATDDIANWHRKCSAETQGGIQFKNMLKLFSLLCQIRNQLISLAKQPSLKEKRRPYLTELRLKFSEIVDIIKNPNAQRDPDPFCYQIESILSSVKELFKSYIREISHEEEEKIYTQQENLEDSVIISPHQLGPQLAGRVNATSEAAAHSTAALQQCPQLKPTKLLNYVRKLKRYQVPFRHVHWIQQVENSILFTEVECSFILMLSPNENEYGIKIIYKSVENYYVLAACFLKSDEKWIAAIEYEHRQRSESRLVILAPNAQQAQAVQKYDFLKIDHHVLSTDPAYLYPSLFQRKNGQLLVGIQGYTGIYICNPKSIKKGQWWSKLPNNKRLWQFMLFATKAKAEREEIEEYLAITVYEEPCCPYIQKIEGPDDNIRLTPVIKIQDGQNAHILAWDHNLQLLLVSEWSQSDQRNAISAWKLDLHAKGRKYNKLGVILPLEKNINIASMTITGNQLILWNITMKRFQIYTLTHEDTKGIPKDTCPEHTKAYNEETFSSLIDRSIG